MKIRKVLNNNTVLVGEGLTDYVWIGTGIGYKRKPGQEVAETEAERIFVLQKKSSQKLMALLQEIPLDYIIVADEIIKYAKKRISYEMSDMIYISLTDHLFNLIQLKKEGVTLTNHLFWEIKEFYRIEFSVGQVAVDIVNEKFDVCIDETEASNIAMHFISAQLSNDERIENIQALTQKIKVITMIIKQHHQIEIDETSLEFERFVTHLRFFFKRLGKTEVKNKGNPLLIHAIDKYPMAHETTCLIEDYLEKELEDDERLYLMLHIQKLIEK